MNKKLLPILTVASSFILAEALWFIQYHPSNDNLQGRQRPSKRKGHDNNYEWHPDRWEHRFKHPWRHFTMVDYQKFYDDILNQDEHVGRLGLLNQYDSEGNPILVNQKQNVKNYEGYRQKNYHNSLFPSEHSDSGRLKDLKQKGIDGNPNHLNQIGQMNNLIHLHHKDGQEGSIYNLSQNYLDVFLNHLKKKSHDDNFLHPRQNDNEDNFNNLSQNSQDSQYNLTLPWKRKGHGSPYSYNPFHFAQPPKVSPWMHFTFANYLSPRRGPWMPLPQINYENTKDPDLLDQKENKEDYQPTGKNLNQLNPKRTDE